MISFENGDTFTGIIVNNKKEGFGIFRTTSNIYYEGNFKNDEKDGMGKLINEIGYTYTGRK